MNIAHLECSRCKATYDSEKPIQICDCGAPLLVRYNLDLVKASLRKESLGSRKADLWRYWEMLPVRSKEHVVSLGEGMTPLLKLNNLGPELDIPSLYMKDEGITDDCWDREAEGIELAR